MKRKEKKVVMYLDGEKSIYKDVLKLALDNYKTLADMKEELRQRFKDNDVTFKVE